MVETNGKMFQKSMMSSVPRNDNMQICLIMKLSKWSLHLSDVHVSGLRSSTNSEGTGKSRNGLYPVLILFPAH